MSNTAQASSASKGQGKKKGKGGLIFFIILLLIIGAIAALLYFNVNNLRNTAFDFLRGMPILGSLIPAAEEPVVGRFDGMTSAQLTAQIERLEQQLSNANKKIEELETSRASDAIEILKLQEFERQLDDFNRMKEAWDREVFEAAPIEFAEYFEKISPQNIDLFGPEALAAKKVEDDIKRFLETMGGMDEKRFAESLDILISTDSEYVTNVMNGLMIRNREFAALVLENMVADNRAVLIKLLNPQGLENYTR